MNRHRAGNGDWSDRERGGAHDPEELGAHALGLLDAAQSRAVEEHLAGCPACRREWEELRGMVDLLDDVPPEAFLDGPPDADLMLQRTVRQVRAEAATQRRRRRFLVAAAAAAAVAVFLGGGVLIGRQTSPPPPAVVAAPGAVELTGTGAPGVAMSATLTPAAGWVRLTATVKGIPGGERCYIVVVARDGTREVAGSWLVPEKGWRDGITLDGSALVPLDQVAEVVVENDQGKEFATAKA
ncbi:anti-sigma factor family protein [Pseudonocardia adelaidensis]|uniref:Zf-HC2 domain-containing protein n=1 Tax=Pseudonocardia adelaidensis TaxID=648754 RepID=A0ABP9NGI8_9PSEU